MTALKHGQGDYSYWQATLQGKKLAMHDGDPHPGFYRKRNKPIDDAVCYFWHGSDMVGLVNGVAQPHNGADVWTHCGHHAVSHADYQHRIEQGRWPNDAEIVAKSNRAPDDNSMEGVLAQLDALESEAKRLIKQGAALSQNEADRASDVANSIAEIEKRVVDIHKKEKEPYLKGGRAVDTTWFPVRDRAANIKSEVKRIVVTPFLVQLRRNAEAEAERARELGVAEFLEQDKIGAGSIKRTVALRTKISAKIIDYDAVINAIKNNAEVRELVQRLADAAARGGNPLPGSVRVETEIAT